jgi:hypothetical protein
LIPIHIVERMERGAAKMKRLVLILILAITAPTAVSSEGWAAQRRRVVVTRRPVRRTRVVIRPGHPIRRVLPAAVVVRPARKTVVVAAPIVFSPAITWRAAVVSLPARDRLVWQDSEEISREEEWVDTNFGIDDEGKALFLDINGRTKLNFAEVTFANGNVQVVDFDEKTHPTALYSLLDFADGRRVSTVRILAKSESEDSKLTVYLSK